MSGLKLKIDTVKSHYIDKEEINKLRKIGFKFRGVNTIVEDEEVIVELSSIEELLDLAVKLDRDIIVNRDRSLTIIDDYPD